MKTVAKEITFKPLSECSPAEILKMINTLDKAMWKQSPAKQEETARAIGILIKTHQAVEDAYRKQNTPFTLIDTKGGK
jgi:hypothetical protein